MELVISQTEFKTDDEILSFLGEEYPSLFYYVCKQRNLTKEITDYMNKNLSFKDDPEKYTKYIQGYFLLWLLKQREAGNLRTGKSSLWPLM